jgi:hypothetical protein
MKANLRALKLYRQAVVDASLPESEKIKALSHIDIDIKSFERDISNYSDDLWIERQLPPIQPRAVQGEK